MGLATFGARVMLFDTGMARGHIGFATLEGPVILFQPLLGEIRSSAEGLELIMALRLIPDVPEGNEERSDRLLVATVQQRGDAPGSLIWEIAGDGFRLGPFAAPGELRFFVFHNRSP
jgi:hypothetical protein